MSKVLHFSFFFKIFLKLLLFFFTLQYCIGFAIHQVLHFSKCMCNLEKFSSFNF